MAKATPVEVVEAFLLDLEQQVEAMGRAREEERRGDNFGPIEHWQGIAEYVEDELPIIKRAFTYLRGDQ